MTYDFLMIRIPISNFEYEPCQQRTLLNFPSAISIALCFRISILLGLMCILTCCVAPSITKAVAKGTIENPGNRIIIPWNFYLSKNRPCQLWIDVKDQENHSLAGDISVKAINHSKMPVSFNKVKRLPSGKKNVDSITIDPGKSAIVYSGSNLHGCVTTVFGQSGERNIEFELLLPNHATGPLNYKIMADWGDGP